jgi:hypothetical protein
MPGLRPKLINLGKYQASLATVTKNPAVTKYAALLRILKSWIMLPIPSRALSANPRKFATPKLA